MSSDSTYRQAKATKRSERERERSSIALIIPALDEEGAIGEVVRGFLGAQRAGGGAALDELVVADNGSSDRTATAARAAGATVVVETRRGYGSACLRGIAYLAERVAGPPKIVVFADGDGSNEPRDLLQLIGPIDRNEADLVIGSRARRAARGSLTFPQRFGNVLASRLLRLMYGLEATDLGPFRAITWDALVRLEMEDRDYGWTVEMQIKAAKQGLRVSEVDVANHPRRAGKSKVGGTVRGVVGASQKIIRTILKYR